MKVCRECGVEKELSAFYKHSAMFDGHLNKCIECVKSRVGKHRELNLDKIRAYDLARAKTPHRMAKNKAYAQSEKGKLAHKKALENYKKKYPLTYAAKLLTKNAIKRGDLVRPRHCSECNSTYKIEGHHNDYTKPLEVRWLCEKCHKNWHNYNEPIYE
jgi:hypothetical protein